MTSCNALFLSVYLPWLKETYRSVISYLQWRDTPYHIRILYCYEWGLQVRVASPVPQCCWSFEVWDTRPVGFRCAANAVPLCTEPNWWAALQSVWFSRLGLEGQTTLNSALSVMKHWCGGWFIWHSPRAEHNA